jgi:hypothetical protein
MPCDVNESERNSLLYNSRVLNTMFSVSRKSNIPGRETTWDEEEKNGVAMNKWILPL